MVEIFWFRTLGEQVSRTVGRQAREIATRIANGEATVAEIEAQAKAWEGRSVWHARMGNPHEADTLAMLANALRQHLNT
jgi:hypothetical protein